MDKGKILQLIAEYNSQKISSEELFKSLKDSFSVLEVEGHTKVDLERKTRCGISEIIYGEGKTAEELTEILKKLLLNSQENILVTRLTQEKYEVLRNKDEFSYDERGEVLYLLRNKEIYGKGKILIVTAGTSDLKVAQEAYYTALVLGNDVEILSDVGVAGIHRLLKHYDKLKAARVLIVIAGMEGALPSVVSGLVDKPVLAVPTSVGYGVSFKGVAALLGMLNSCGSGVSVFNIDNGFGAAYQASLINRL
jgi:NCAIR mutase (PurE)-related protein